MLKLLLPFCTKIYSLHSGEKSQGSGGGWGLDNMEEALRIAWMILLLVWITTCQWEGEEKVWSNHNLAWSHSNWQHKPRVFPVAVFLMIKNHSGCLQWENLHQEQSAPLVCSLCFFVSFISTVKQIAEWRRLQQGCFVPGLFLPGSLHRSWVPSPLRMEFITMLSHGGVIQARKAFPSTDGWWEISSHIFTVKWPTDHKSGCDLGKQFEDL